MVETIVDLNMHDVTSNVNEENGAINQMEMLQTM